MAHIIVIGGHGKVALQLARMLTERGGEVSSVLRNPDHTDDVAATGAAPVRADIEQLDTAALAELLARHDAVVFSAGAGGGNPARTYAVDRDATIRVIDARLRVRRPAGCAGRAASGGSSPRGMGVWPSSLRLCTEGGAPQPDRLRVRGR